MNKQEIELNIELLKGNVDGFKKLLIEQPDHPMRGSIEHQIDALEMAISALEKQIPKKPIIKSWSPAKCPSCGNELSTHQGDGYYTHRTFMDFCDNKDCLQRLDWGNEDE